MWARPWVASLGLQEPKNKIQGNMPSHHEEPRKNSKCTLLSTRSKCEKTAFSDVNYDIMEMQDCRASTKLSGAREDKRVPKAEGF